MRDEIGGATVVVTCLVAIAEIAASVGVGVHDCGAFAGIQKSRQISISKSMSAITSLNRSYPGARADVSMLTLKPFLSFVVRIPWLA